MRLSIKAILASCLLTMLSPSVSAQEVYQCDWRALAENLVEPWEENSRVFSNGQTRLALLDTVEPAAGAMHLLILSPPYGEIGERQCRVISLDEGTGFSGIDLDRLQASYDPAIGLTFAIPNRVYNPDTGGFSDALMVLELNQATGVIQAINNLAHQ